jgi:hypothetical protein
MPINNYIIDKSQIADSTSVLINTDKENMLYRHSGVLFSHRTFWFDLKLNQC